MEYRRASNNELRDRSSAGAFGITPLITSKPGVSGTGNSIASLLLGEVSSVNMVSSDQILSRAAYWAWYVQDDWRVTDRLTVNAGLRWESELPRRVDEDRQNSFDLTAINPVSGTPGIVTFSGRNGVPRQAFNTDLNNFGPRLGFAYRAPILGETIIRGGAGVFYGPTVSNTIGDVAAAGFSTSVSLVVPQADTLSAIQLRNGVPATTRPELGPGYGAVAPGEKPNFSVGFFERDRPTPISYQYNLNIQHELRGNTVVEVGYMGNVSHHLTANDLSLNQVPPELIGAETRRRADRSRSSAMCQFSMPPLEIPRIMRASSKPRSGSPGASRFWLTTRFRSSSMTSPRRTSTAIPASYMDAYNRRLDKSLSGTDVPHRTVLSALYEAPSYQNKRLLNAVLGSWKVGLFATLQSGAPFTVVTASNTTNAFTAGPLRPNIVDDPQSGERTLNRWFNTAAFSAPAPFTFGNSPRSNLRGPYQQTVDMTLGKEFAVRNGIAQIFAESSTTS